MWQQDIGNRLSYIYFALKISVQIIKRFACPPVFLCVGIMVNSDIWRVHKCIWNRLHKHQNLLVRFCRRRSLREAGLGLQLQPPHLHTQNQTHTHTLSLSGRHLFKHLSVNEPSLSLSLPLSLHTCIQYVWPVIVYAVFVCLCVSALPLLLSQL